MSYIDKIRDRLRIGRLRGSGGQSVDDASKELPLDHQLTFNRDSTEQWKYKDGRLIVNDVDVEDVLQYESKDVRLWCAVSGALMDYKDEVMKRGMINTNGFFERIDSVQDKVLFNMKRLYDEKTEGVYLSFGDGAVLFNNFNVRAFLALYHMRPTEKARRFLIGLKSKLALILVNRNGTPQYERVHRVVQRLYDEVVCALEVPPIETRSLPPAYRSDSP